MRSALGVLVLATVAAAQGKSVTEDRAWANPGAALKGGLEAAVIVRVGDVDNLNFGWPEGFDPFCGRMTSSHDWPWKPAAGDVPGLDRILLGTKFSPNQPKGCGADGYSGNFDARATKPVALAVPLDAVKGTTVSNAFLQLFIDDFQAPALCSKFQVQLNGRRFVEAERVLNAINQTGPVGKLVTVPIPEEFWADLTTKPTLSVLVDEVAGAPDGFAIDFVRLLVNRKRENTCKGAFPGRVVDAQSSEPVPGALVSLADGSAVKADAEGRFQFSDVPTGFEVVRASAQGYADGTATADVGQGDNDEIELRLEKGKALVFDEKPLAVGQALALNAILFDQSKADLKKESKPELDRLVAFLKANPTVEIELSGHTSSEGDAASNRSLSYRRVQTCKRYVTGKGIDEGRIVTVGHGPDRPVAPNDSEAGRKANRRVELRVLKN
ncbi:MAG: OmpA family protein [Myxococcaceae bacterium]|nr:OmpA family protein [Myxococcaceae bacterium]